MVKVITGILIGAASMFVALYVGGHDKRAKRKQTEQSKPSVAPKTNPEPKATPSEKVTSDDVEETVQTIITPSPVVEDENGTKDQ